MKIPPSRFYSALFSQDFHAMRLCLNKGFDVNRLDRESGEPIWLKALRLADRQQDHYTVTTDMFREVLRYARVTPPVPSFMPPLYLGTLKLNNVHVASLVLLRAIAETKGAARIDLAAHFRSTGVCSAPLSDARKESQRSIILIHRLTANSVTHPHGLLENEAAAALVSPADKAYWSQPLAMPMLQDLPTPAASGLVSPPRAGVLSQIDLLPPFSG